MDYDWATGLMFSTGVGLFSSLYLFFFVKLFQSGWIRVLLALPVIVIFAQLPWIFDPSTHIIGTGLMFLIYAWLGNFKVLTFCWNRGPLSQPEILGHFLRFHLLLTSPINVSLKQSVRKKESRKTFFGLSIHNWPLLIAGCCLKLSLLRYCCQFFSRKSELSMVFLHLLYLALLYLFASMVEEFTGAFANLVAGIELEPHFDKPYLASSLQDFWSRRWNLTVSSCLREAVYLPVVSALMAFTSKSNSKKSDESEATRKPSSPAKFVAVMATFFVSGIMHELAIFYLTYQVTGEMMAFFLLHGVATAVEGLVVNSIGARLQIPWIISVVLTVGFTFYTAILFFFPPFISLHIDDLGISHLCHPRMAVF